MEDSNNSKEVTSTKTTKTTKTAKVTNEIPLTSSSTSPNISPKLTQDSNNIALQTTIYYFRLIFFIFFSYIVLNGIIKVRKQQLIN